MFYSGEIPSDFRNRLLKTLALLIPTCSATSVTFRLVVENRYFACLIC